MGSTHQNVKQIVNKLEEAGYVETKQDEVDKRKLRVRATEKISVLSEKYKEQENNFMKGFYEGISETEITAWNIRGLSARIMACLLNQMVRKKLKKNHIQYKAANPYLRK